MRWFKVVEGRSVSYRGYDGQTTVWTIEKITCGGRSYIYSAVNHQTGERFGPFRRLDRAKAFAENPNPVTLHLLGV